MHRQWAMADPTSPGASPWGPEPYRPVWSRWLCLPCLASAPLFPSSPTHHLPVSSRIPSAGLLYSYFSSSSSSQLVLPHVLYSVFSSPCLCVSPCPLRSSHFPADRVSLSSQPIRPTKKGKHHTSRRFPGPNPFSPFVQLVQRRGGPPKTRKRKTSSTARSRWRTLCIQTSPSRALFTAVPPATTITTQTPCLRQPPFYDRPCLVPGTTAAREHPSSRWESRPLPV